MIDVMRYTTVSTAANSLLQIRERQQLLHCRLPEDWKKGARKQPCGHSARFRLISYDLTMEEQTPEATSRTVFVRSISFGVGKDAVEQAFEVIGPIRKCFLVQAKGDAKHKGYGYVQFALREDAAAAVQQLNGTSLGGRKLKVDFAAARAPLAERKRKAEEQGVPGAAKAQRPDAIAGTPPDEPPAAHKQPAREAAAKQRAATSANRAAAPRMTAAAAAKQRMVLTVAIGGIPSGRRDAITQLAAAAGKVVATDTAPPADVIAAAKLREDGCTDEIIFVTYATNRDVMSAVSKLHGCDVTPAKADRGRRSGTEAAPAKEQQRLWARQVAGEGAHLKTWRIIIRNLSFQVNAAELRQRLEAAGFVWDLSIARSAEGKLRGFAFASFTCRADAERAIALLNQQVIHKRPIAVDWAVAKSQYQTAGAASALNGGEPGSVLKGVPPDSDAEPSGASDTDESMAEEEDEAEARPVEDERAMQRSMLAALLGGKSSAGSPAVAEPSSGEDADADDEAGSDGDAAAAAAMRGAIPDTAARAPARVQPPQAAAGDDDAPRTVFVRSLPAGTTEAVLRSAMSKFGPLKACRIVIDKATGQPKGTAFVEYRRPDSAANASVHGQPAHTVGITVAGRKVLADLALPKDEVRALALDRAAGFCGSHERNRDRRNLYLASEGEIAEGSPAWESVPAGDRDRRKRAAADKALKLRSPNFAVSTTRLAVRNIPASMSDKALKQLALQAVKAHASRAHPHVKQVKILREDVPPGAPAMKAAKSRGRGFIEFTEHEHALCALRQLNNNPQPFGAQHRPIIEFAIDDMRKLRKRQQRMSRPITSRVDSATGSDMQRNDRRRPAAARHLRGQQSEDIDPAARSRRASLPRQKPGVRAGGLQSKRAGKSVMSKKVIKKS